MPETIEIEFILEDLPKLLSSMKVGATRVNEIVLSLRNFSRLDQAEIKFVDIHEGIENTLIILKHSLKARPERVEIELIKEYDKLPLFDPFFTTKAVGKGTGLGLSISYQIVVEKHGGELYCISTPGEGSEFIIKIPVVSNHSDEIQQTSKFMDEFDSK
jgi:signal transduction histidine kinase